MKSSHNGFTLLEILITIAIVVVIAIALLAMLNPQGQLKKIYDFQRKRDLNQMTNIFEEYYSDKQNYPRHGEICIDEPIVDNDICSCHICGLSSQTSSIASYSNRLYCDPTYPRKKYLYQYDCSNFPSWYRICASLDIPDNDQSAIGYNYGVSSTSTTFDSCYEYVLDITPYPTTIVINSPTPTPPAGASPTLPPPTPTSSVSPTSGGPTLTPTVSPTPLVRPTHDPGPLPTCYPDPIAKWCWNVGCNNCGTYAECLTPVPARCTDPIWLYTTSCQQECEPQP